MEPVVASDVDSLWFCAPTRFIDDNNEDNDDDEDGDDEQERAVAMRHAAACIAVVTRLLGTPQCREASPRLLGVLENCVRLWRAKFKVWQAPCGNHLNVPDMLFVAACHLRAALDSGPVANGNVAQLQARILNALKEWDRVPGAMHGEHHSVVNACARVIVYWGSNVTPVHHLTDTTLTLEDVSLRTMNVNVHQNMDNRARNTDIPVAAAAAAAVVNESNDSGPDVNEEDVLATFVRLASRYAFFTSLHYAAQLACKQPRLPYHQKLAANVERPTGELVNFNIARLHALFRERSSINMPECVQRDVTYTIWKRLLSVGSMEEYLRMTPTIQWHKLNPVTVSIREPTAATVPGSLARTVSITDYQDVATAAEWPHFLRQCHRDVWNLALWHQLFTEIDMVFLEDYVVLAHDIRQKADLLGNHTRNWRPRRPVIVRACATWCVHALSVVWCAETLEECLYLWAWLIVHYFDCCDETGASLHQILQRTGLQFY